MKFIISLFLVAVTVVAASASTDEASGWRDENGRVVANTDISKAINGFGASVILTPDADWEKKWNTPAANTPSFTTTDNLKIGEQATILIFFANPKLDSKGSADVTCDIKIIRPNNITSENLGLKGFSGELKGPTTDTFLTETVIRFVGESSDPLGEWTVDISVHDNIRKVTVPLRLKFTLLPAEVARVPLLSEKELNDFMVYYYLGK